MAWQPQSCHTFASVGADGSVRVFDLRNMEHSTIIHESKDLTPLLRLSWNKQDTNYMAAIGIDDRKATILDIRVPSIPVAKLATHAASVNSIAWAPHSSVHICSAGDDKRALIWDLSPLPKVIESPILGYEADAEINQMQWCALEPDWIAIACGQKLQILKV